VLYLADSPVTALQEVEALVRTRAGLFPVKGPPRLLLSVEVTLSAVLDLTQAEFQQALGTNLQELTGSWVAANDQEVIAPTQRLGRVCNELGMIEALRVPSARDPRAFNLAVFPDRLANGSSLHVFDDSGIIEARLP
jgi:RES domain-containing protein